MRSAADETMAIVAAGFYRRRGKRAFDVGTSIAALVLLSPLLAVIALAIYLGDRGTILFQQTRIGRNGRTFRLLKFRTMPQNVGDLPSAQASALPVTDVGRLLRRANLDELPQLVNILRGDMSVVGPRPALPAQGQLTDRRRANGALACAPGLTGLAQVRAYSGMSDEEKASHDGEYAATVSFGGDLTIILRTVRYLLRPPPVY